MHHYEVGHPAVACPGTLEDLQVLRKCVPLRSTHSGLTGAQALQQTGAQASGQARALSHTGAQAFGRQAAAIIPRNQWNAFPVALPGQQFHPQQRVDKAEMVGRLVLSTLESSGIAGLQEMLSKSQLGPINLLEPSGNVATQVGPLPEFSPIKVVSRGVAFLCDGQALAGTPSPSEGQRGAQPTDPPSASSEGRQLERGAQPPADSSLAPGGTGAQPLDIYSLPPAVRAPSMVGFLEQCQEMYKPKDGPLRKKRRRAAG